MPQVITKREDIGSRKTLRIEVETVETRENVYTRRTKHTRIKVEGKKKEKRRRGEG